MPMVNFTPALLKSCRITRGLATHYEEIIELTEPGAFWVHLVQNHFALNYVNTLWTQARLEAWPQKIDI